MIIGKASGKSSAAWIAIAALALAPAISRARGLQPIPLLAVDSLQDSQEARDREQEKRDREQEARDREQEKRDREQEARDRAQEKRDRPQELHDASQQALYNERSDRAR